MNYTFTSRFNTFSKCPPTCSAFTPKQPVLNKQCAHEYFLTLKPVIEPLMASKISSTHFLTRC